MPLKIFCEFNCLRACGVDDFELWVVLGDMLIEDGIVRTSEDNRIDIMFQKCLYASF